MPNFFWITFAVMISAIVINLTSVFRIEKARRDYVKHMALMRRVIQTHHELGSVLFDDDSEIAEA